MSEVRSERARSGSKGGSFRAKLAEQRARDEIATDDLEPNPFSLIDEGAEFVSRAKRYAKRAIADVDGAEFGIWIRKAAERFLNDLERAKKKGGPFTFDPKEADRVCRFIELLPHVEGTWSSPTIELVDAQVFFLVNLFGFRKPTGGRRFSTALWAVARKNAKSTIAAAIELYVLCEEPESGGQLYSAATTGAQAKTVFRIAKMMVERSADMRAYYGLEAFAHEIRRIPSWSFFKAINAKASTQDGLNPQSYVLDELHAHKTHDLMNVLSSASGARENPLYLYTTTEGYESPGPWPEIRAFAQNVLKGLEADHFFALIYALDEEDKALGTTQDDDFDESKWIKANPLYNDNPILRQKLRELATEAKAMSGKLGEFRIKRLNRQASSARAWIDLLRWKQCSGAVDLNRVRGFPCWAAFDLATTTDLAAWALLWLIEGEWFLKVRHWCPRKAADRRAERRSAPYHAWIDAGFIKATDGDVIDYDVIEADLLADVAIYQPIKIAYDSWNAQQFVTRLQNVGLELEMFIQGPRSYNPAMQALELAYMNRTLHHGGDPVLQWEAANIVPRYDVNMNMAPDKKRSADKIDGMIASLMAFGLAVRETEDNSAGFFAAPVRSR